MDSLLKYAELFQILSDGFTGGELGKKATQKMFYFFERKGIELNLKYGIHYYGPYSSRLDNLMHILESEDYLSIDTSGTTHKISLGNEHLSKSVLSKSEKENAKLVIEIFAHRTPMELEALTTMDFIANSIFDKHYSKEKLINKFKEIKGTKFNNDAIEDTIQELNRLNFISV